METKLSLVNHLLQVVGERRVVSLTTGHPSVTQALNALEGYNRDFQTLGWWFNKNRDMRLLPTTDGEILIPDETLSITVTQYELQYLQSQEKIRFAQRGNRLYDSWRNTYAIDCPVNADIVVLLDIEDLPQVAASYLKHWSAENYCLDDDGDNQKVDRLKERTMLAWHALKAQQMKAEATNALDSPEAQKLRYRIGQMGSASNPTYPGGRYR